MRRETLLDRLTRLTLELRYDAAAARFMRAARRLAEFVKYNPDWHLQPRGPDGRWIDAGGSLSPGSVTAPATSPTLLAAGKTRDFNHACRVLKVDPHKASAALHAAKEQIRNDDNCIFDLKTGDIIFNGEIIGNLRD